MEWELQSCSRFVKLGYSKQITHSFKPCGFNVGVCKSIEVEKKTDQISFLRFCFLFTFHHFKLTLYWKQILSSLKHSLATVLSAWHTEHCLGSLAWLLAQSITIHYCNTLTIEQYLSKYLSKLVWSTRLKVRVLSVSFG